METNWWVHVEGRRLAQGDYLSGCFVPLFDPTYGTDEETHQVEVNEYDCIVVTQSCDLENGKAPLVALCPVVSIAEYEEINPSSRQKGSWERVRTGRVEGLHLLKSMEEADDKRSCLVVDFHEIYSLPVGYLESHASQLRPRWRLQSPFLEHFSQAFARFFMRVGLPSAIQPFK